MSSILKIITDIECQVYCDYELKGNVTPGTLFRIDMRKGIYLLEFKIDNVVLLSKEYEMCSNDEEQLLRVSLSNIARMQSREIQYSHIAALDVKTCLDVDGWYLENNDTKERTYLAYNISEYHGFDECGLLYVNVGGISYWNYDDGVIGNVYQPDTHYYAFKGGQWGCVNKQGEVQIPVIYDKPVYFYGPNVAVAESNGQIIFINKWNETVFENIWDKVVDDSPFLFGKCIVEKNGNQGVIDERGCEVLPLIYSKVTRGKRGQFAVQINDKWGLVSDECSMIYPITFDIISDFYWPTGDFIVYKVKKCGKEGLLGSNGRLIFPIVYEEIENKGSAILVKKNGLYGLYYKEKQIFPIELDEIKYKTTPAYSKFDDLLLVSKNLLWGVLDSLGNSVVPIKYNKIEYHSNSRDNEGFVIEKDSKWGYISIDGNIIISPLYDSIIAHDWQLKCLIVRLGERFGLVSVKGEVLLPVEYISISIEPLRGGDYCGFILVMGEDGFGVYTDDGNCIIKPEYKEISASCGGFIVTDRIGAKRLFDKQGNVITDEFYDDISWISGCIATKLGNVWKLWTHSKENGLKSICWVSVSDLGDDVSPKWHKPAPVQCKSYKEGHRNQLIIEEIRPICDFGNYAVIDINNDECKCIIRGCHDIQKTIGDCYVSDRYGKKGLYNKEGILLYENTYDEIIVKDELIFTIQDDCYLIYDYEGATVFEKKYKKEDVIYGEYGKCGDRFNEACLVTKDGKWGCLNYDLRKIDSVSDISNVKEIIPCEYDYVAFQDKTLYTDETKEKDAWIMYFVKKDNDGVLHYYRYKCEDDYAFIIEEWVWPFGDAHYLFIDTETTGLPKDRNAEFFESENWPYIVQVSIIVMDSNMGKIAEKDYILAPENYTIPRAASDIHGITNEYALKNGLNRKAVLEYIIVLLQKVDYVIGHNVDFDIDILKAEIFREYGDYEGFYSLFASLEHKVVDTMKMGIDVCKIPSSISGEKYKWPTLNELYIKLFGRSFQGQHNAMNDVKATYECYCKMIGKNS